MSVPDKENDNPLEGNQEDFEMGDYGREQERYDDDPMGDNDDNFRSGYLPEDVHPMEVPVAQTVPALPTALVDRSRENLNIDYDGDEDDPLDVYKPDGAIYLDIDCFSDFCRGAPDGQQRLSKPVYVRGLPWKILAIPRDAGRTAHGRPHRALGFFLQCNGDSDQVAWNCVASATLKVISQTDGIEDHARKISHTFYPKENDWGYSQFLSCDALLSPEGGYIANDTIKLMVHVAADAPHGVQWDSKKHAGHIGLKNQGATCYMNSILQTLYFTNKLRRAVYEMRTMQDEAENNVALAMQRVFYDLQHCDKPVGTKKLTKSFGWDSLETFMQHDVQELCRVLLDNLESKMKGSSVEDTIPNLFRGRIKSYIKCTDVDFESSREEIFYDIQLNIKGKNDIVESFREYVQTERLDGDNKYDAGDYGLQPAEKGVKFLSMPPVLHLQLMRFQYDPNIDGNVKINDRFEFPNSLNLNEFVADGEENDEDYTYRLHAVLVHSGDFHGGHYVVFINTNLTGPDSKNKPRWCKFDDDVVSRATVRDAITANYGGEESDPPARTYTNAYMLVYVKESEICNVLAPINEDDIPKLLRARFENERFEEIRKKKEKMEAHLYTEVMLMPESHVLRHHGFDLIDIRGVEEEVQRERVQKTMTVNDFYHLVGERIANLSRPDATDDMEPESMPFRLWRFDESTFKEDNAVAQTLARYRPSTLLHYGSDGRERTLDNVLESDRNLIYIEGPDQNLPPYDESHDMIMFAKYFCPGTRELNIVGHVLMCYKQPLGNYLDQFRALAKLPPNAPLRFYEEVTPSYIREIDGHDIPMCNENVLAEIGDGGILIFECLDEVDQENNARVYVDLLYNTIDVELVQNIDNILCPSSVPEPNYITQIGLNYTCDEVVNVISEAINYDAGMIMLWRMSQFNDRPTQYLSLDQFRNFHVKELLGLIGPQTHDPRKNKRYRVLYTKMPIRISEIERRKQMKVILMDDKFQTQEVVIFPEKTGTVTNIIAEVKSQFPFAPNGTGKLRLVYVGQNAHTARVYQIFPDSTPVVEVFQKTMTPAMYTFRIEEVPNDQLSTRSNEYLLPVAHFDKDPSKMFGVPFFFKVQNEEPLQSVRDRLQKRLEVPEKEFEKYKFALVASNRIVRYLDMESGNKVNLAELGHTHVATIASAPYLGLDHINRSRTSRSNHVTEKPIIIHN